MVTTLVGNYAAKPGGKSTPRQARPDIIGGGQGALSTHLRDEILDLLREGDRTLQQLRRHYAGTFSPGEVGAAVDTRATRGQVELWRDHCGGCLVTLPIGEGVAA